MATSNIINDLYHVSLEFCRDKEMEYRDALIEDLDHGDIDPTMLDQRFDQEIVPVPVPEGMEALQKTRRIGEIEFFSMMAATWLFHLNVWLDDDQVKEMTRRYLQQVVDTEPEWMGVYILRAPGQEYPSARRRRIMDYLECLEGIVPILKGTFSLNTLYDRFTQRLLGHIGFDIWTLPKDLRDSRRFMLDYSGIWQEYVGNAVKSGRL